jgi:hypothetical protein
MAKDTESKTKKDEILDFNNPDDIKKYQEDKKKRAEAKK